MVRSVHEKPTEAVPRAQESGSSDSEELDEADKAQESGSSDSEELDEADKALAAMGYQPVSGISNQRHGPSCVCATILIN
jgi:hypothetical protein